MSRPVLIPGPDLWIPPDSLHLIESKHGKGKSGLLTMKILVAPDSFKECLDTFRVAAAISAGLRRGAGPGVEVVCRPLADGGEGLMEVLLHALDGTAIARTVTGPMGVPVKAEIGLLDHGRTAAIEMAGAAGLHLVAENERDPLRATTYGVGELICHALDLNVERIIVGLGGSATNDGGAGMAQALGVSLKDADGKELSPGGGTLARLSKIDMTGLDPRLRKVTVTGACDVENLLCGRTGASRIYGPQKGATPAMVEALDEALHHYGSLLSQQIGRDLLSLPGSGAAGGLGAGLAAFTGAPLRSGVQLVFEAYGDMDALAAEADLLLSGEGSVDGQTLHGKVIAGMASLARKHDKPLVVMAGRVRGPLSALHEAGVTAVFPITLEPMTTREAISRAESSLEQSAENIVRLLARFKEERHHA